MYRDQTRDCKIGYAFSGRGDLIFFLIAFRFAPASRLAPRPPHFCYPETNFDVNAANTLVIMLAKGSETDHEAASLAFRYAETAAALDFLVEIHVVGKAISLFSKRIRDSSESNLRNHEHAQGKLLSATQRLRRANELGVKLYVCSAAMAEANLGPEDLVEEVSGVRGAASLLSAAMAPNARLLSF